MVGVTSGFSVVVSGRFGGFRMDLGGILGVCYHSVRVL